MAKRAGGGRGRGRAARGSSSGVDGNERAEPSDAIPASKPEPVPAEHARVARGEPRLAGLYLIATPIGNLGDITLRALETLRGVDLVACEDTRVTAKLMARHAIGARLVPYHEHNAERMRPALLRRLAEGGAIALVSDAGTPLVSDPGFKLVRAAIEAGHAVTALPGPSALLTALQLSGLPPDRFLFAGFLPAKPGERRRALARLADVPATLIFYESAHRLAESLADMTELLGDRPAALARELTKLHEEVRREPLSALARHYAEAGPPRGEIVLVVAPPDQAAASLPVEALDEALRQALRRMSLKDAVAAVAGQSGLARKQVYARALVIAGSDPDSSRPDSPRPDRGEGGEP